MRLYLPDLSFKPGKRGTYTVLAAPNAPRPNRTAAGMTATLHRSRTQRVTMNKSELKPHVLTLSVRGTLDSLAAARFDVVPKVCPCCGHRTAKLALKPGKAEDRKRALARTRRNPFRPRLP